MKGLEKKPLLDYGFLFNAGTEREEAHGLNWDMTPFRPLDNALGRFFGIDLLSEDYVSFSPMHFGLNNPISLNDPLGLNVNDFDDASGRKEVDAGATGKKNQRGGEVFDTVDELVGYLYSLAGDGETHFTFKGEGANLRIIRISFLSGGSTNKNQETGIWQVPGFSFSSFDVQVRGTARKAIQSNEAFAFYSRLNDSNQQWYNGVVSPLMDAVTAVSPLPFVGYAQKGISLLAKNIGNIKIPVYRKFGGGISNASGEYWSLINPRLFGRYYRNFSGLPDWNTAAFQVKGAANLRDIIKFGKIRPAAPFHGNFGRVVPELKINPSKVKPTHYNGFRIN